MQQVSRDKQLKVPKKVKQIVQEVNSSDDWKATEDVFAKENHQKREMNDMKNQVQEDKELLHIQEIPWNAHELIVITTVKKLGAYIITITEKSPKKFRGVFVNRMQNYCLEIIELLLQANFLSLDNKDHKIERETYQKEAIIKLKMLGYIAMVAENAGCILMRQYHQISKQIVDAINLTIAWKKSDDARWKKKQGFSAERL